MKKIRDKAEKKFACMDELVKKLLDDLLSKSVYIFRDSLPIFFCLLLSYITARALAKGSFKS
ncbi:tRNA (cmo5U34)-methyltransferase [Leptospira ryugenii]|uniref:tRNA (Cmo5U34)-methyltransferase n=1 Tax=Leptospira ryugenii TaxID=1917863 RepID=A0A2P2E335_9LEPT|nr:tRNA (cmo5U34)-methyltransferase [Leptospira ryugenii]